VVLASTLWFSIYGREPIDVQLRLCILRLKNQ